MSISWVVLSILSEVMYICMYVGYPVENLVSK